MCVHENEVGARIELFLGGFGHVIIDVEAVHARMVAFVGVRGCVEQVPFQTWSMWPIADLGGPVM